jgi:hypothetical protein
MPAQRFTKKANTPAKRRQWSEVERSAKARGATPKIAIMEANAVVRDHPAKPKRRR